MNTTDIIHQAEVFRNHIASLKNTSPIYPSILFERKGISMWVTTMVEFDRNGVRFRRHCVESIIPTKDVGVKQLYNSLIIKCELIIKIGYPCEYDEVVGPIDQS